MPQIPLGDTVTVAGNGLTGGESYVVGTPPVWKDNSDATYAEFSGYYFPGDPQFVGTATTDIGLPDWTHGRLRSVMVRLRVASVTGSNVRYPRAEIVLPGPPAGRLRARPTGITPTAPGWIEFPLEEESAGDLDRFADAVHLGGLGLTIAGAFYGGDYGGTVPSETQRWQVYEAELWAVPFGGAPPCRNTGRDDWLGVGGAKNRGSRSQQAGVRNTGYY